MRLGGGIGGGASAQASGGSPRPCRAAHWLRPGRCILSQSAVPEAGPSGLTWLLRLCPAQWRPEPQSTCEFAEVLPDSSPAQLGRTLLNPRPARHGPSVPQPLCAPAAAAAAGTLGPLTLQETPSGPTNRTPAPSPFLSFVVPSSLLSFPSPSSSKKVWVQRA